jgi:hypothetical protein
MRILAYLLNLSGIDARRSGSPVRPQYGGGAAPNRNSVATDHVVCEGWGGEAVKGVALAMEASPDQAVACVIRLRID